MKSGYQAVATKSPLWGRVTSRLRTGLAEGTLIAILVVLFVVLSIASRTFFTSTNLSNLVRTVAINGIIATGMTFVIISAGIDLSVGSVVGLSSVLVAMLLAARVPVLLSILIALAAGTAIGVVNGVLIHEGRVPPFIATLGMMTAVRGLVMEISGARMISGLPSSFVKFTQITMVGIPSLFVVWLVVILLSIFVTRWVGFGRNVFAVGSNVEAARLSGVNIRLTIYGVYAVSAFLSAVAGILLTSRLANGIPTAGQGYELDAIAAAVVGGASLFGGVGTILGTALGALIIATLRNGGDLLLINPFILQIAIGSLIIVAVLIDQLNKRERA